MLLLTVLLLLLDKIPASKSCCWVAFIPHVEKVQIIYFRHKPYRDYPYEQLIKLHLNG